MESEEPQRNSYSVQFRVQRITTEFAYINVPVTGDLIVPQPDGTGRLDFAKMVEQAKEISQSPGVK